MSAAAAIDISRLKVDTTDPAADASREMLSAAQLEAKLGKALHRVQVLTRENNDLRAELELLKIEGVAPPEVATRQDDKLLAQLKNEQDNNAYLMQRNRELRAELMRMRPCNRRAARLQVLRVRAVA